MVIKLRIGLTGSVDGIPYPPPGIAWEVPDHVGRELCKKGLAHPSQAEPDPELAVAPEIDVETREDKPLTKASVAEEPKRAEESKAAEEAPVKRGPGRPRKHAG